MVIALLVVVALMVIVERQVNAKAKIELTANIVCSLLQSAPKSICRLSVMQILSV